MNSTRGSRAAAMLTLAFVQNSQPFSASRSFDAWRDHSERMLRWMTPLAVIVVGGIVLLDFHVVMDVLADTRASIQVRLW